MSSTRDDPAGGSQKSRSAWERLREWWRQLWSSRRENQLPSSAPPQQLSAQPQELEQPRYEVQGASGQQVAESDSLTKAHQQWQQLTDQKGYIIDRQTGQDVTPEPDDSGRYVVLQKDGKQVGSFDDREVAERTWADATSSEGKIIDMQTREDVTPRQQKLNDRQVNELMKLVGAGHGYGGRGDLSVDPDVVARMIKQLNQLDVPAYRITNLRGKGRNVPTKTVPIVRRKVTIEKVKKQIEVDVPGPPAPSRRMPVRYVTDEPETQPVRSTSDLRHLRRRDLAVTEAEFGRRFASGQLRRRSFVEETPGKPTVQKRKVWQESEEPKVQEWTEEVEVTDEQQSQLLELVVDVSGSMTGTPICLAIALASVVMGAHFDDDSEYLYRQFADEVGELTDAKTPEQRRKLIRELLQQENDLGGGTRIYGAISQAADDVRRRARQGQAAEILLITDGDDWIDSAQVFAAIGEDVTLHTVIVGYPGNEGLREKSTTYYELSANADGSNVRGAQKGLYEAYPYGDFDDY